MGYVGTMVGRALIHGTFVALVAIFAIAQPELRDRPAPPWLHEACAEYDVCDDRTLDGEPRD